MPAGPDLENSCRDIGGLCVPVPENWSVIVEEKNIILPGTDDGNISVGVMLFEPEGKSLRQAAVALSKKTNGSRPKLEDGTYMFTFSEDGIQTTFYIEEVNDGKRFLAFFIVGDDENPGVDKILRNIDGAWQTRLFPPFILPRII